MRVGEKMEAGGQEESSRDAVKGRGLVGGGVHSDRLTCSSDSHPPQIPTDTHG